MARSVLSRWPVAITLIDVNVGVDMTPRHLHRREFKTVIARVPERFPLAHAPQIIIHRT
ncbi:hypothetical protein [uncultured Roseobacter sp.]|uniref:hypothetical protein n=1 Tax=uncultured Roseobacter sp. TaxID=114847 RepID=UPI002634BB7D|nr:hypothetical protein [uncultured Roseobacter sp.]